MLVRKERFELSRSCERQPLKLVENLRSRELTRILQTDLEQECADAHASADFIRTSSHTTGPAAAAARGSALGATFSE